MRKFLASELCKILPLISLFLGENKESDKGLAWIIRDIADIHVLLGFLSWYWHHFLLLTETWWALSVFARCSMSVDGFCLYDLKVYSASAVPMPVLTELSTFLAQCLPHQTLSALLLESLTKALNYSGYATYILYFSLNCRYMISALYLPLFSFWSYSTLPVLCSWITDSILFYPVLMQIVDSLYLIRCCCKAAIPQFRYSSVKSVS